MGHFTDFYGLERKVFRGQIDADPTPGAARNRIGDVISRAGRTLQAGPSVKQGFQLVSSAMMYLAESVGAIEQKRRRLEPLEAPRHGSPPVMWIRILIAVAMLLLATFWAGSFETQVTCTVDVPQLAPAGLQELPKQLSCSQTKLVPQAGLMASALVLSGIVLLLLEGAALLTGSLSRIPILNRIAPPPWLNPYASVRPAETREVIELAVDPDAVDRSIERAFEQLDKAKTYFHEPAADDSPVPPPVLGFLQRAWAYADQGDQRRLTGEMRNIEALLGASGLELRTYDGSNAGQFEVVEQTGLAEPTTLLPAIAEHKSGRLLLQGQAFVPSR